MNPVTVVNGANSGIAAPRPFTSRAKAIASRRRS